MLPKVRQVAYVGSWALLVTKAVGIGGEYSGVPEVRILFEVNFIIK